MCPSFSFGYVDKVWVCGWGLSRMKNSTRGCWTRQLSQENLVLTRHRKPPALTVWVIIKDYRHNTWPRFVSATSSRGLWWALSVLFLRVSESLDLRWWDNQLSVLHGKPWTLPFSSFSLPSFIYLLFCRRRNKREIGFYDECPVCYQRYVSNHF